MGNDILKTLQSMEEELIAIKSAKEQVEAAVAADAAISSSIKNYSMALSNLSHKFAEVKDDLKEVAKSVSDETEKFSNSLKRTEIDVENATKNLSDQLNDFKKQAEDLGIKIIVEKTGHIYTICNDLAKKLSEVEKKNNQIVTNNATAIKQDMISSKNTIISEINARALSVSKNISIFENDINKNLSSIEVAVSKEIDSAKVVLERSAADSVQTLIKDMSSTKEEFNKTVTITGKKQMWISIVVIVLISIDIILHFI